MASPANAGARVARVRYSYSLALLALKMRRNGAVIDSRISDWIIRLTKSVISDYGYFYYYGHRNNIYAWTGALASTALKVKYDKQIADFEANAYQEALRAITEDGTLPAELMRFQQSLVYHNYYLTVLLTWIDVRYSRQQGVSTYAQSQIRKLVDFIGKGQCDLGFVNSKLLLPLPVGKSVYPLGSYSVRISWITGLYYYQNRSWQWGSSCMAGLEKPSVVIDYEYGGYGPSTFEALRGYP